MIGMFIINAGKAVKFKSIRVLRFISYYAKLNHF